MLQVFRLDTNQNEADRWASYALWGTEEREGKRGEGEGGGEVGKRRMGQGILPFAFGRIEVDGRNSSSLLRELGVGGRVSDGVDVSEMETGETLCSERGRRGETAQWGDQGKEKGEE